MANKKTPYKFVHTPVMPDDKCYIWDLMDIIVNQIRNKKIVKYWQTHGVPTGVNYWDVHGYGMGNEYENKLAIDKRNAFTKCWECFCHCMCMSMDNDVEEYLNSLRAIEEGKKKHD